MDRRDFLTATAIAGIIATTQTTKADIIIPGARRERRPRPAPTPIEDTQSKQSYILIEIFYTSGKEKRDILAAKFDSELIPLRHEVGFDKIGVFTVNNELMKDEHGYDNVRFDNAVFVVQQTLSPNLLLSFQEVSAKLATKFNLEDDLDFIDEEIIALRSFPSVPEIEVPFTNKGRVIQLRTYNSPNYVRNFMKEAMFEEGELALFRNSGMAPVFFGNALFGSMAPNITYMLSFEDDKARREGWSRFVNSEGWKTMSKDPKYARTATRIRNLFLTPTSNSEI